MTLHEIKKLLRLNNRNLKEIIKTMISTCNRQKFTLYHKNAELYSYNHIHLPRR